LAPLSVLVGALFDWLIQLLVLLVLLVLLLRLAPSKKKRACIFDCQLVVFSRYAPAKKQAQYCSKIASARLPKGRLSIKRHTCFFLYDSLIKKQAYSLQKI
jgi:hypothetical protein